MPEHDHLSYKDSILRNVVTGGSDGLAVPLAMAAGLSPVVSSSQVVLVAGIAVALAGSIAMGFGGYSAAREETEPHTHHSFEEAPLLHYEEKQLKKFFADLGLSEEMQQLATAEMAKDRKSWNETLEKYAKPTADRKAAARSGLVIAISYITGGILTLLPFLLYAKPMDALKLSALICPVFLFLCGWIRNSINGSNAFAGGIRGLLTGMLAAAAAFGVAQIFLAA